MGGSTGVVSRVHCGSTFWLAVTLEQSETVPLLVQTEASADDVEQQLGGRHSGKRVLLAEDDPISQGMMQAKINLLRDKLARAVIVERAKEASDEVVFGATVVVKDLKFGDEEIFVLVGAGEEDYDAGRINVASPLAQGLLGKKVGEKVSIDVPAGTMKFEILEVRFDD